MARTAKKETALTAEEKLAQALISDAEQPYQVPENWCWTRVGVLSSLHRGVSYKKDDAHSVKQENDCLVMRGGNIGEGYIDIDADNVYVDLRLVSEDQLVKKNDVIIVASTGSTKVIGRAGISLADYPDVAFGAFLMAVRPNKKAVPRYLDYYFQSDLYRNRIRDLASGVNINNIRADYITESPYPLPPFAEQQRIVDRIESLFAKLDEAKEKAQAVVDGFEDRKAAILHKAFTGELTAEWRERHDLLHSEWRKKRLDEFAEIVSGFAFSSSDFKETNCVPCIKITNVGVGEFNGNDFEYLPAEYISKYERFNVKRNDILISLTRSYIASGLKVCIYPDDEIALLNQRVALIRDCNIKYAFYYLISESVLNYVKEKSKTTNQPNLSIKDLCSLTIPVPPKHEQLEIAALLDSLLDREKQAKEAAEQVIDQIDTMKKSILARAFRGELGTNDPTDESAEELLKRLL